MSDLPFEIPKVYVDLVELPRVGDCLLVTYDDFSYSDIKQIKALRDNKFVPPEVPGGPGFRFPVDLEHAKRLREAFGDRLIIKPKAKRWAEGKIQMRQNLGSLTSAEDAELELLPDLAPKLMDLTEARKWQRADIKAIAQAPAILNANQPGLGKTIECIGGVIEGGMMDRSNLVIAPVSSLDTVWWYHLHTYQPHDVIVAPYGPDARQRVMGIASEYDSQGIPFWLVVNPAMLTMSSSWVMCDTHKAMADMAKKGLKRHPDFPDVMISKPKAHEMRACEACEEEIFMDYPEFRDIEWGAIVLDEFHLCGLGNPNSKTYLGLKRLTGEKKVATSGTPIGGKPIKLYGCLSWLYPNDFTSKWRFADEWLTVEVVKTKSGEHKRAQGLNPYREQAFYEMMSAYMIRRLKSDVAKDLPPVTIVDLWVDMHPKQRQQYEQFADMAELRIDEYNLSAVGILAEYARLKQFANSEQTVEIIPREDPDLPPQIVLHPTENSSKLPEIKRILAELGITGDEDQVGEEQVIIFSESTEMVDMVSRWLAKEGIPNGKITGAVTRAKRTELQKDFQSGALHVMCMNTKAGGVAITLDRANTVILLDETWNPDDQEQAIDRAHRLSRIHQVTAYFIRTNGTIQEVIEKRVLDKSEINDHVIDFRAKGLFDPSTLQG